MDALQPKLQLTVKKNKLYPGQVINTILSASRIRAKGCSQQTDSIEEMQGFHTDLHKFLDLTYHVLHDFLMPRLFYDPRVKPVFV